MPIWTAAHARYSQMEMEELARLRQEVPRLRAEIERLQQLLREHGEADM